MYNTTVDAVFKAKSYHYLGVKVKVKVKVKQCRYRLEQAQRVPGS